MCIHKKREVHVTGRNDNKSTVTTEGKINDGFEFDVDKYLTNGCMLLEDAIAMIENSGEILKQTLEGNFTEFNHLPEKSKSMIMKHWPRKVWDLYKTNEFFNSLGIEMLSENLAFSGEEAREIIHQRVNKILDHHKK